MIVDPAVIKKALAAGVDNLYDADGDGDIDAKDISIIKAMKIPGVRAELRTKEAIQQFDDIESASIKSGFYKSKSLAWGAGGRSELLRDRLLVQGYTPEDAETVVKQNYLKQRYDRMQNGLPV